VDYFPVYHATLLHRAAPAGFNRTASFLKIVCANIAVDLNQINDAPHFDNSSFASGVEHINELWSRIEAGNACMTNFGRLTHTVQDFYSHSNWVELHDHLKPIPTWDLNLQSLPALTLSGTFRRRRALDSSKPPTHSELNKDSPFAWFSPTGARVVANGPNQGTTLFELGYHAALAATRIQFDRLMRVLASG